MRAALVIGLAVVLGLSVGCDADRSHQLPTSHPSLSPVADAVVGCPARLTPGPATTVKQARVVPVDAAGAQLCGYVDGGPLKREPADGVRLDGNAAAMLGYLIDHHATRQSPTCGHRSVGGLVRFDYPGGQHVDVTWAESRCGADTLYRGGIGYRIDRSLSSMLQTLAGAYGKGGSGSVPQLTGLSSTAARSRAHAAGFTADLAGQEIGSGLPAGTVVLQAPPAGGNDIGTEVDVLLSARPAAPCPGSALALAYRGGGLGTGNDFGGISVRDTGHRACTLRGAAVVRPLTASGRAIHTPQPLRVKPPDVPIVLRARARPVPSHAEPSLGEIVATFALAGAERDGPGRDGLCPRRDEVTPAFWRVLIGGHRFVVVNHDPHADVKRLVACLGRFSAGRLVLD